MTSKDLCKNVSINVETGLATIDAETFLEIKKDLEELKKYRKVMCKPIVELIKDLERLEKQDKILNALLKNAKYEYDEWYGMRGNQCIMIGITEKDECFEEIREMVENYGKD